MSNNKPTKKNEPINFNFWKLRINHLYKNIESLDLFEHTFHKAKDLVEKKGIYCEEYKDKTLKIKYAQNAGLFSINYFKDGKKDCLQIIMGEEGYFSHLGLMRSRGNLLDLGYRPKIVEEEDVLESLDTLDFGQFHPEKIFFINEDYSESKEYDFRTRQSQKKDLG